MKVSIVIPFYNEKESLPPLIEELTKVLLTIRDVSPEFIMVDDGSTDGSEKVLKELTTHFPLRVTRFRRNCGKSAALQYGFRRAKGDFVLTLDADLQDDPKEIPKFIEKLLEGSDVVCGWRRNRQDPWHKKFLSKIYNAVTSQVAGIRIHDFNCGFKAYRKSVVKEIEVYGELHRYIPVLAASKGFRVSEIVIHHRPRIYGKSKFGFGRVVSGFLDLITTYYVTRFSKKPSHLFNLLGFFCFLTGMAVNSHLLILKIIGHSISPHYPYMVFGVLMTLLGIQLICIGLLSELMISLNQRFKREYTIEFEYSTDRALVD